MPTFLSGPRFREAEKVVDIREALGKLGTVSWLLRIRQSPKKETIIRSLKAYSKAVDYIKRNPKETVEFLKRFTGQTKRSPL